jgi:hypothetical protein
MLGSVEVVDDGSALSLGGSRPRLILNRGRAMRDAEVIRTTLEHLDARSS